MSEKRIGGRPQGQKTRVTRKQVYAIIVERFTANPPRPTSKIEIRDRLHATMDQVRDHMDGLFTDGEIVNVSPGYFVPTRVFEDRSVSLTTIPGGRFKAECGDEVMNLSPRELSDFVALGFGLVRR